MKALIPTSIPLSLTAHEELEFVSYDPSVPVPDEHIDADVMVAWGNSRKQLSDSAQRLQALKWVAALSAGVDVIEAAGFAPEVVITNGSGLHDGPVAEHALAMVLSVVRRLDLMYRAQLERHWARELGGAQPVGVQREGSSFPGLGTLDGARVTLWGFGAIAQKLAQFLKVLGAEVTGVANSAGERSGFPVIAGDDIFSALPTTDLLVSVLPSLDSTKNIINEQVFEALPSHAWVVNVGRGATLDETALNNALRSGAIGGAALDVFAWEPLPQDSPLWTAPNLIATPHAAGGRPLGACEFLDDNFVRFLAGEQLRNEVPRNA